MEVFKGKGWAQIYAHKEGERCTGEEGYYLAITLKAELTFILNSLFQKN